MISFISYSWEPFAIGPLVPIFLIIWLFFTIVSLLMKFTTDLITCLHALTMYHERNKSYIMQLFKNEKLLSEHYYFAQSAKKNLVFCLDLEKFGKVFLSLEKCLHSLAKTLPKFSKNQKLSQCPMSSIEIYKSLHPGNEWTVSTSIICFLQCQPNHWISFNSRTILHWFST